MDGIHVDLEPLQHAVGFHVHFPPIDEKAFAWPPAKEDVLTDIHIPAKREILVDHFDADVAALVRALEMHRLSGNEDFAGIALISAGQDLHERRLPGRVVAN